MAGGGVSRALRQFTWSKGKSAGRNSLGRITIWHRGGGAKRLQRTVDLKRNTPAMGVVERIEYDPNRSCRIALVRWKVGADQKEHKAAEEFTRAEQPLQSVTPKTVLGPFAFSSLPENVDHNKFTRFVPAVKKDTVMIGGSAKTPSSSKSSFTTGSGKMTSAKDVFFNAFSTKAIMGENSFDRSTGFPRIAVAGAKPPFFVFRQKEILGEENAFSLGEIKKWKPESSLWEDRLKRKAAVSWNSFGRQERLGLVGASQHKEFQPKSGTSKVSRAPCSYIIASNQLEVGKMVMNCEWSKPSPSKK